MPLASAIDATYMAADKEAAPRLITYSRAEAMPRRHYAIIVDMIVTAIARAPIFSLLFFFLLFHILLSDYYADIFRQRER